MASSDDEAEAGPIAVSNYHFVDHNDEPVSFSVLPIQWNRDEQSNSEQELIFLHGTSDNGLQKVYKHAVAWRFDLVGAKPEISVLSKEKMWIKLLKPRKSFEDIIRSILITVHCLHFLRINPEASAKSLWDHLNKVFSMYDVRPSQRDLVDHMPLINEAVKREDVLSKSKFLLTFLEEVPNKLKPSIEDARAAMKSRFIVDYSDEDLDDDVEGDGADDDVFDSVCAICDNGGNLLCCEGSCMRSFHATVEAAGEESPCDSLGYSEAEVDAMQNFVCKNCELKKHQCFSCGKLGSSDKELSPEVFRCVNATCGHFYHPHCVAKLLHGNNKTAAEELAKKIVSGESFTCPIHKCCVCKQGENKKDLQLQFAMCRRCPKSYHRKCLPREIAFEDTEDEELMTRAWEGLLPHRILIYCLDHVIDEDIGTPVRDHIIFPGEESKVPSEKKKTSVYETKSKRRLESSGNRDKFVSKKRKIASEDPIWDKAGQNMPKSSEKLNSAGKMDRSKAGDKVSSVLGSRKLKTGNLPRKPCKENANSFTIGGDNSLDNEKQPSLGDRLYEFLTKSSDPVNTEKQDKPNADISKLATAKQMTKLPQLDLDTEKRLLSLINDTASSISLEDVIEKHQVPSTHAYSAKYTVDKTITLGKLEGSVEAVRAALQKLEEGCTIEDAEAVCGPEVLSQLGKWKSKLRVFLAPFLYGLRYSSFGRHFTKPEKLQQIVGKLHLYVREDDTIVDFCCGANDFSMFMKKKLEETGKKCSYKNYDFIPPKNDFCFEKRDWMTVQPKELPVGSKLIMGLNPPFGVKAALANKFIDKALEFRPKLLILIVPPETERLDLKDPPYELVWEDGQFLSGKSFYLPGSIDIQDKQMDQWNLRPPPLYLWSRKDWASEHQAIAQEAGHIKRREESVFLKDSSKILVPENPPEDQGRVCDSPMDIDQTEPENSMKGAVDTEVDIRGTVPTDTGGESSEGRQHQTSQCSETSGNHCRERIGRAVEAPAEKHVSERPSATEMAEGTPNFSKHTNGRRASVETPNSKNEGRGASVETPNTRNNEPSSHSGGGVNGHAPSLSSTHHPAAQSGTAYPRSRTKVSTENDRRPIGLDERYSGTTYGLSGGTSPSSRYEIGDFEERLIRQLGRGAPDGLGYRPPYISELEERQRRESEIRSYIRLYGQQGPDHLRNNHQPDYDPRFGPMRSMSSTYANLRSPVESTYRMSASAMDRYAPRLDELNHSRMGAFGSRPEVGRNGAFDFRSRPGYRVHPMGFAPGPRRSGMDQNSAGWLNE